MKTAIYTIILAAMLALPAMAAEDSHSFPAELFKRSEAMLDSGDAVWNMYSMGWNEYACNFWEELLVQIYFYNNTGIDFDTALFCIEFDSSLCTLDPGPWIFIPEYMPIFMDTQCVEGYNINADTRQSIALGLFALPDTSGEVPVTITCEFDTFFFETTFVFNSTEEICREFYLSPGWNLISYPDTFGASTMDYSTETFYRWDNPAYAYFDEEYTIGGIGYWVLSTSAESGEAFRI